MSQYYNIPLAEMVMFLEPQGFRQITVPGTYEVVFGKRVDKGGQKLTLRVNTGIQDGESRGVGDDAIKILLVGIVNGQPKVIGTSKRVHRVNGWRSNLQARLDGWLDYLPKDVCTCGAPMLPRKRGGEKKPSFLGCSAFPVCRNTRPLPQQPVQKAARPRRFNLAAEREVMQIESMQM